MARSKKPPRPRKRQTTLPFATAESPQRRRLRAKLKPPPSATPPPAPPPPPARPSGSKSSTLEVVIIKKQPPICDWFDPGTVSLTPRDTAALENKDVKRRTEIILDEDEDAEQTRDSKGKQPARFEVEISNDEERGGVKKNSDKGSPRIGPQVNKDAVKKTSTQNKTRDKGKGKAPLKDDDDDDDDDDMVLKKPQRMPGIKRDREDDEDCVTPARGRLKKLIKGKNKDTAEDSPKEEDEEELDADRALALKTPTLSSRTRLNGSLPKKSDFRRKLDELNAKRTGIPLQKHPPHRESSKQKALYDSTSEEEGEEEEEDNSSSGVIEDDIDDFIIPDDETTLLGAPDASAPQIPLQFTRFSHQSPKANFKIFCQWLVHSYINPSFPRDDEIFIYAIRALDDQTDAYSSSVLQSSIWKPKFVRAMKARPNYDTDECDERHGCDACGIMGRTATFRVCFSGPRYDRQTLEDLEGSDAEDDTDSVGFSIPEESTEFFLGRSCHTRAEMSHAFLHWKRQLRGYFKDLLEGMDLFSPESKRKAAGMSPTARTRWANSITDTLQSDIDELYGDFKRRLGDAQSNMTKQRLKTWR